MNRATRFLNLDRSVVPMLRHSAWMWLALLALQTSYAQTAQEWTSRADAERDPVKAETYYSQALRLEPKADAVLLGRAIVRGKQGRYQDGIVDATAAIVLNRNAAPNYAQRAYLRVQLSEYDAAADDYERALAIAPREATYHSGLSYCRVKQNRLAEALQIAQRGIDLNPDSPYPYRNRGRARMYSGKVEDAIVDFNTSLARKHGEAHRVLTDLGEAYELKKEYETAFDYYNRALKLKPNYPDAEARQFGLIRQGVLKKNGHVNPVPGSTDNQKAGQSSTFVGKRVALIVGNSDYLMIEPHLKEQPVHDADSINAQLKRLGFQSVIETNTDEGTLRHSLETFYEAAKGADLVFFYFAGHGLQYDGANYLLPTDIEVHPKLPGYADELRKHAFLVTTVIERLQKSNPKFCLIVLDACREDPHKKQTAPSAGTASAERATPEVGAGFTPPPFAPIVVENYIRNCCVAQATTAGSRAWNGSGRNGCYTEALLRHLQKGRSLEQVLKGVRNDVLDVSHKAGTVQRPEFLNQTTDDLIF